MEGALYRIRYFRVIAVLLLLSSCQSTPDKEVSFVYRIEAAEDINPSVALTPSPVLIRVMQLNSNANFNRAGFGDLLGSHEGALGSELIQMTEYLIQPGSQQQVPLAISKDTKHLGVVAGFRDIENASWRSIVSVPEKGWFDFGDGELIVRINKLSIRVLIEE